MVWATLSVSVSPSTTSCCTDKNESKEKAGTEVTQKAANNLATKAQHISLFVNALLVSVNEPLLKHFENNLCLFSLCFTTVKNMALLEKLILIFKKINLLKESIYPKGDPFSLYTAIYQDTVLYKHTFWIWKQGD